MLNPYRWRILLVAMVGYGLVQVGAVTVNITMPTLSQQIGVPLRMSSWLLTGYLLALTAFCLPAGRLGDRYGHRQIVIGGLAALVASTLAAGLTGSYWPLLAARLAQGAASAFVTGTAMAWVANAFPAEMRGRVVSFVTLSSYLGGISGAYLGTWVLAYTSWQWIFLTQVPIGILVLLVALTIPPAAPVAASAARRRRLDWLGALLLGLTVTAFSLGLSHAHEGAESWTEGWEWHLPMNVASVALGALFILWERRARDPIMPLHHFSNRAFVAALGANIVLHFAMMGTISALPFLIEVGMSLTPGHVAGTLLMLQVLSLSLSPVSGWLYDKTSPVILLPGSMALLASAMFLYGLFTVTLSFPAMLGLSLYMGLGMGLFLSANNAALVSSVPQDARGFATGILETTRQLGHSVAVAIMGTLLSAGVGEAVAGGGHGALEAGFRSTYWIMSLVAVAGVLLSLWHVRERRLQALEPAASMSIAR